MYFWNVSKLAEDLQEGRVDEHERFKYFLAAFVAGVLVVHLFAYYAGSFELLRLIPLALNVAAGALGIYVCYGANRGGDNKDFIGRMVCLGWPCAFRTIALMVFLFVIMFVAGSGLERETTISEANVRFLRTSSWTVVVVYFFMIVPYIGLIAQGKGPDKALQMRKSLRAGERLCLGILVAIATGAIAWAIIVNSGLPGPLNGFLGLAVCVGLTWLLLIWIRKQGVDSISRNLFNDFRAESGASETKTGSDRENSSVG